MGFLQNEYFHDPIRHLKALTQILSQDKNPIGFFISAGCPLSIKCGEIENKIPLIPDMKGLQEYVQQNLTSNDDSNPSVYDRFIEVFKKINPINEGDSPNLEKILSFIRSLISVSKGNLINNFKEEELITLEKEICKHIVEKIKVNLPTKNTPYHKLANWISSIDREQPIEIFTTNYDLLMEQALEDTNIPYFDGFVGSREAFFDLRSLEDNLIPRHWTRLGKMHGSINWFKKENGKIFRSDKYDNSESSYLIYPSHLKYDQSRKMPFLALSDQLNCFLKKTSSALIVCGYSFNDEHINDTITNALISNPSALVITLLYGNIEYYPKSIEIANRRHNLIIWAENEAIIGTHRGKWRKANDINYEFEEFIEEENEKIYFKMGDFITFSNYLRSLIGRSSEEI